MRNKLISLCIAMALVLSNLVAVYASAPIARVDMNQTDIKAYQGDDVTLSGTVSLAVGQQICACIGASTNPVISSTTVPDTGESYVFEIRIPGSKLTLGSNTVVIQSYPVSGRLNASYPKTVTIDVMAKATRPVMKIVSVSYKRVRMSWSKYPDTVKYQIYRSRSANKGFKRIKTINAAKGTSYADKRVLAGKTYYYKVRPILKSGHTGVFSEVVKASPALKRPTLKVGYSSKAKLSWGKISGATGYYLYRCKNGGSYKKIASLKGKTISYTDKKSSKLSSGTYTYKIKAYRKYKKTQYYNSRTKKWQNKKPAKKNWIGKRTRRKVYYTAYSKAATASITLVGIPTAPGQNLTVNGAQVSCGRYFTAILKKDGSLWTTGYNIFGQLGVGTEDDYLTTPVKIMDNVAQVSCGGEHIGILTKSGTLYMAGRNTRGQLGNDNGYEQNPTPRKLMDNVAQVSCGYSHTAILKKDGTLWMTGTNSNGQLGDGTTTSRRTPVKIMSNVVQVSCGEWYTGILKKDGTLWMTGSNYSGELGVETDRDYTTKPVKVKMSNVVQVSCGWNYAYNKGNHTAILKKDGTLWMTGCNDTGELGNGTKVSKKTPVKVMSNVAQVSSGEYVTAILKRDGSLWMTGSKNQFGIDATGESLKPVKVTDNVAQVSCGYGHVGILRRDGSVWMTGSNLYGQLGIGNKDSQQTRVKVMDAF